MQVRPFPAGGRLGIARALASANSILPLHLRPEEPTAHPVYGEKHVCQGLLVRVAGTGSLLKGEVVARVGNLFLFHGMADFQYVGDATLAHQKESPVRHWPCKSTSRPGQVPKTCRLSFSSALTCSS